MPDDSVRMVSTSHWYATGNCEKFSVTVSNDSWLKDDLREVCRFNVQYFKILQVDKS